MTQRIPDKSQVSKYVSKFDEPMTWLDTLRKLQDSTSTGWLRGYKLEDYEKGAKEIDNEISKINPNVLFIPPKIAITLFNYNTRLEKFKDQTQVISMLSGMGSIDGGTKHQYYYKDYTHYYLSNYVHGDYADWMPCEFNWFVHRFCTIEQWDLMQAVFSRVPGVIYL